MIPVKKAAVLFAGTLVLAAVIFFKPLAFLENILYDVHFLGASSASVSDFVVIVGIDAESISSIGGWPWQRSIIATLLDRITACEPRTVAIDVLFPLRSEDAAGNDSLAHAISRVPSIVLPFRAGALRDDASGAPVVPQTIFAQRFLMVTNEKQLADANFFSANRIDASDERFLLPNVQSGVINVTTSKSDQKLREIVHVIRVGNEYYPSFGLRAVAAFTGVKPTDFVLDGAPKVRIGSQATVPLTTYAGSTLVRFRGRPGTIKTISAADVLSGKVAPETLRGKLVFVGVTDQGAGADFFITPVGSQYPGVELWATSALDILQKSWITHTSGVLSFANILIVLLLFPGLALIFPAKKKVLSLAAGIGIVAVSFVAGIVLFSSAHIAWDVSGSLAAYFLSLLFIAAQKGVPGLAEDTRISFDVPPADDHDSLPPPSEEEFLRDVPDADTARFVAHKIRGSVSAAPTSRPADTLAGTMIEEHNYMPSGAAVETKLPMGAFDKKEPLSVEQAAEFSVLSGGRIVRLLGSGGMADVYLVWNPRIEMYRAVKVIKPGQPSNLLARFETEIRILSKLSHPGIVQFFTVGEWHSLPYIEMEYVPGFCIEDIVTKTGTLTAAETMALGIAVCRALDYAHNTNTTIYGQTYQGVIHRDLKPANIMLSKSGRIKLADFGIARPQSVSLHTMDTGTVVGTLPYLAPEQLSGTAELTRRVDVYALGATLYEFLTGRRAFPQTEIPALLSAKTTGTVAPLPAGAAPKALSAILLKAMAVKAEDRFESAAALEQALSTVLRSTGTVSGHAIMKQLVKRTEG